MNASKGGAVMHPAVEEAILTFGESDRENDWDGAWKAAILAALRNLRDANHPEGNIHPAMCAVIAEIEAAP